MYIYIHLYICIYTYTYLFIYMSMCIYISWFAHVVLLVVLEKMCMLWGGLYPRNGAMRCEWFISHLWMRHVARVMKYLPDVMSQKWVSHVPYMRAAYPLSIMYKYKYTYICICVCVFAYIYTCLYTYMYTYIDTHIPYMHSYAYIHMYT